MSLIIQQFFKRYSMRETPQIGNEYLFFSKRNLNSVIMSLTRGQSAWALSSSETQHSAFSSDNLLLKDQDFVSWLVGVTDGDGTFSFIKSKKNVWSFSFQISQSSYNLRLLYYIKHKLKVGSITVVEKNSSAVYRIRNKKNLVKHILPLFDTCPLITSKHFKYIIFKKALLISNNVAMSSDEKDRAICKLKDLQNLIPENYKSPAWFSDKTLLNFKTDVKKVINKSWLIGFVEAEGSFYIVKKGPNRLVHGFEITQKLDKHVLDAISLILEIKTGVKCKKTHFTVVTCRIETVQFLISYFFKRMKGMKSLEYRIWARSFNKRRRGFNYLLEIREKMRNIRSIRFDKYWKKINNFKA